MARKQYPSDHRRWLRLYEDVLDDPKLEGLSLAEEAAYFKLLAVLNRQKSRDGNGWLGWRSAAALFKTQGRPGGVRVLTRLVAARLLVVTESEAGFNFYVAKWPELQGFTPASLRRDSGETPAPTPTPTPIQTPSESGEAPLSHPSDRLLNLLGREPGSVEEKRAWIERELPLLEAKAEAEHPGTGPEAKRARSARMRSLLMTHWRNRELFPQDRPAARSGPQTFAERRVENTKQAGRDAFRAIAARRGLLPEGSHGS